MGMCVDCDADIHGETDCCQFEPPTKGEAFEAYLNEQADNRRDDFTL